MRRFQGDFYGFFGLCDGDDAIGYQEYDDSCSDDAGKYDGNGVSQSKIEEGSDEGAGPGSCARKWYGYKKEESEHFILDEFLTALGGFFFHFCGQSVEFLEPVHPVQDSADENNNERYRNHIAEDADNQCGHRRQPHAYADRQGTPELYDRYH